MSCGKTGVRHVISSVCAEMGFPTKDGQDSFHELLDETRAELGAAGDEYVDPMEAGAELRAIIRSLPTPEDRHSARTLELRDRVMDDVESGRTRFTRAQLSALTQMPAHVKVAQMLGEDEVVDGESWRALVEQRNCEICGQFIGRRVAHVGCGLSEKWQNRVDRDGCYSGIYAHMRDYSTKRDEEVVPLASWPGAVEADATPAVPEFASRLRLGKQGGFSGKYQVGQLGTGRGKDFVDTYFAASPDTSLGRKTRDWMLQDRLANERIGDGLVCRAPREVLLGVVDDPHQASQKGIYILAQYHKERLTGAQIRHMLDDSGVHAAAPLLAAPRTREKTAALLRTEPEFAATRREVAKRGYLPDSDVNDLAASADPADKIAAVHSPNLSHDERVRLATDPNPNVALALTENSLAMKSDPEAVRALLRHPDESVRSRAAYSALSSNDPIVAREANAVLQSFAGQSSRLRR